MTKIIQPYKTLTLQKVRTPTSNRFQALVQDNDMDDNNNDGDYDIDIDPYAGRNRNVPKNVNDNNYHNNLETSQDL
eukprot:15934691-Heterocapsa_arctica.AAC.1